MKNKWLMIASFLVLVLAACKKDEHKVYYEGGTAPALTASRTGSIPLSFANQDQEAIRLSWTNPNYQFTTGLSSQNVTYELEIDTVGANFTNPLRQTISISNDLSRTLTQSQLNDYLLNQLLLKPGMSHTIEMRVSAFIGASRAALLRSNALQFTVTPYAIPPKVQPPTTGKLFIVGNATPGGWNNPVPVPSQEFTKISDTQYEITLSLTGGNFYLLLPLNGDWGVKYGAIGGNGSNNALGDDFRMGGGDLIAPAVSGTYKIEVNFQTGKFKLTKL